MDVMKKAKEIMPEIIQIRRHIHAHPELGGKEYHTSDLIKSRLIKMEIDDITTPTDTSVIATIRGRKGGGRCIALRADIDALPVQEETGLDFASEKEGIMHACGHDMHTAMMLGNAKLLYDMRNDFRGTVKLIFQHSKDTFPGGARELIDKGVVEGVDAILGMHVIPTADSRCGVIGLKEGPFTTSVDEYLFNIAGTGGDGSQPHKSKDPILAAAEMIMMFQQVQSRAVAPMETAIFMMNMIEGGHAPNVIADKVTMLGHGRAYTEEVRQTIRDNVFRIAHGVEIISGCLVEVKETRGYDACYNDPELTRDIIRILRKRRSRLEIYSKPMGFSEDFSFYSSVAGVPSVLMVLQAGNAGSAEPLSTSGCTFNESAMAYGMSAMTSCTLELLNRG